MYAMAGQRQFNERQALHQARDVFWLKGYGATSMQDIENATGVLRGSLYNAYRDKETLFLRVFEEYSRDFLAEAGEALTHPDIGRALTDLFDLTIESMTRGVPPRGCLTTKAAIDTKAEGPRIRAALRDLLDSLERIIHERLSKDDARGRLTVPPADAARILITMTRGTVIVEGVYQDTARARATARSLVAALLRP
jgi:AcrR family transcriptional regulator